MIIFGYSFTKFNIFGSLYLFDLLLVVLFILSLIKLDKIRGDRDKFLFIIIGIIFLVFSLFIGDSLMFVLRQYMIVGYFIMIFFIFQKIKHRSKELIEFLLKISKFAFVLQLLFLLYIFFVGKRMFGDFNYFSPVVVMLFPVYTAKILIYEKKGGLKLLKLLLVLIVSTMLGHSSAFLAVFVTILSFFILKISKKQFLIILGIILLTILFLYYFAPQFRDVNANWRIYYWGVGIKNTLSSFLFGNGFGKPFINTAQIQEMINIFGGSNDLLNSVEEPYYKAYHNSFITMFFHLGIFTLLLSRPYFLGIKQLISGKGNNSINFIVLSLIGVSTWVSFNVILELPHSSLVYWLIFLLTSNQLKLSNET